MQRYFLLRKIHKRDAPFRAVFEVKTLAVLFPPYPREMKTNTRNLNLPPFCRLFVSIGPGKRGRIVADTLSGTQKMFLILFRNILCPQQMFPSLRSPRKIMGNNVSATMCPRLPGPYGNGATHFHGRSIARAWLKVIPLKLFYYQTFFETWRNEHS